LRRTGYRELSDDRILGSGKFVERIINEAEVNIRYRFPAKDDPEKINEFIAKVCKIENISIEELKAGGRRRHASGVRAQIAIGLVETHGVSLAEVARHIGVSTSAVSKTITRANKQVNFVNNVPYFTGASNLANLGKGINSHKCNFI